MCNALSLPVLIAGGVDGAVIALAFALFGLSVAVSIGATVLMHIVVGITVAAASGC